MLETGHQSVQDMECKTYLRRETGEVVGGLQSTGNVLLDVGVTAVVGGEDGVLEATGVLDVKIDLASLAVLGDGNARADGGDVGVVDQGDSGAVARDGRGDSALGATGSTVGDTINLYLDQLLAGTIGG